MNKEEIMKKIMLINDIEDDKKLLEFNKKEVDYILTDKELCVAFVGNSMEDKGGNYTWKGRSTYFLGTIISILFQFSDKFKVKKDINLILNNIDIQSIRKLSNMFGETKEIKEYLLSLPKTNDITNESHEINIYYLIDILKKIRNHFNYEKDKTTSIDSVLLKNKITKF